MGFFQTFIMEFFLRKQLTLKAVTILAKYSMIGVWEGSYTPLEYKKLILATMQTQKC